MSAKNSKKDVLRSQLTLLWEHVLVPFYGKRSLPLQYLSLFIHVGGVLDIVVQYGVAWQTPRIKSLTSAQIFLKSAPTPQSALLLVVLCVWVIQKRYLKMLHSESSLKFQLPLIQRPSKILNRLSKTMHSAACLRKKGKTLSLPLHAHSKHIVRRKVLLGQGIF